MKSKELNKYVWEKTGAGNQILRKEGWKVSFNPDTNYSAAISPLGFLNNFNVGESISSIETALLVDGDYLILNGDWRENYENIESKKDAVKFFRSKEKEFGSDWSSK